MRRNFARRYYRQYRCTTKWELQFVQILEGCPHTHANVQCTRLQVQCMRNSVPLCHWMRNTNNFGWSTIFFCDFLTLLSFMYFIFMVKCYHNNKTCNFLIERKKGSGRSHSTFVVFFFQFSIALFLNRENQPISWKVACLSNII